MRTKPLRVSSLLASMILATTLSGCFDEPGPFEPHIFGLTEASRLTVPLIGAYTELTYGCAVRSDGVVRCWSQGQITIEKAAATGAFTLVKPGAFHTCALRSDGAVECWGQNSAGQAPPVVTPPSGTLFVGLASGNFYSCALRNDGVIQCWGDNTKPESPATRVPSSGLFSSVAASSNVTCGITTSGVIECFGNAGNFTFSPSEGSFTKIVSVIDLCAIRTGGIVECHQTPNYQRVPMPGVFVDFSVTSSGQCGINLAGAILCIGGLSYTGQTPSTITASSGTFTQVRLGEFHICALRSDGGIFCTGLLAREDGAFETVLPTATFAAPASVIVGQPVSLSLTNAQVPGFPLATTFRYAFDCGGGTFSPSVPGTASTAMCPTSTTGTRMVRGKVVDEDLAESIYSATVTVKSTQQATTDLLTEVQLAPLAPDIRKALITKLDAALGAIAKGKKSAACSALKDFINQVNAQRGKAIPVATADAWILAAQQLQAAVGC